MKLSDQSAIQSHESLAKSLSKLGYFDEVVSTSEPVLAIGEGSRRLRARRAWALAHLGRATEAMREGDLAMVHGPAFPRPDEDHVRVLCVLGRFEEALSCLDATLKVDPADHTARATRALLLLALGHKSRAVNDLETLQRVLASLEGQHEEALVAFSRAGLDGIER